MDIRKEIQKMVDYNFDQKSAVEQLLPNGFSEEDIKNDIFNFYPKVNTNIYFR
jgi:ribosomal protein L32E